jgi:hypothetical protein
MLKRSIFLVFIGLLGVLGCVAQPPIKEVRLDSKHTVLLLDSAAAAQTILQDRYTHYFDKVNAAEMSIQMKKPINEQSREQLLPYYMGFLQMDMESFDYRESKYVAEVIEKVFKTCQEVNNNIFPDTLKLIKTRGRHYGDGVWYTRENCIIIPANEIESRKTNPFTTTMFHEVFHVYSRLNLAKSAELYRLIGFESIGLKNLELPQSLAERVLLNPDGVDFAQKIALAQEDKTTIQAIPIIYSKKLGHETGQDEFFSYLEFNLFQIEATGEGKWRVVTQADGFSSTLNLDNQPDFFRQIRDNTGYIIHPDEVLADNFAFIMGSKKSPMLTAKFSPAGKELLRQIEEILKK